MSGFYVTQNAVALKISVHVFFFLSSYTSEIQICSVFMVGSEQKSEIFLKFQFINRLLILIKADCAK